MAKQLDLTGREFLLVLTGLLASLILAAFLNTRWTAAGADPASARYWSALASFPVLLMLLLPVIRRHWRFIVSLYDPRCLSLRLVLTAVFTGVLMRACWWLGVFGGGLLGWFKSDSLATSDWPQMSLACPPAASLVLGIFALAICTPVIEEFVHRGMIQSALLRYGPKVALPVATVIFTLMHPAANYPVAFVLGLIMAVQYHQTGTLWLSTIFHATYNGLIQFDWRCLQGTWQPDTSQPWTFPLGVALLVLLAIACAASIYLVTGSRAEALREPRPRVD